jgi:hypothetical protein
MSSSSHAVNGVGDLGVADLAPVVLERARRDEAVMRPDHDLDPTVRIDAPADSEPSRARRRSAYSTARCCEMVIARNGRAHRRKISSTST